MTTSRGGKQRKKKKEQTQVKRPHYIRPQKNPVEVKKIPQKNEKGGNKKNGKGDKGSAKESNKQGPGGTTESTGGDRAGKNGGQSSTCIKILTGLHKGRITTGRNITGEKKSNTHKNQARKSLKASGGGGLKPKAKGAWGNKRRRGRQNGQNSRESTVNTYNRQEECVWG